MRSYDILCDNYDPNTRYHYAQIETSVGPIGFDVAIATSELHTFVFICDRSDQEKPAVTRFSNECVKHILDCEIYLVEDALRNKTAVFLYYDPDYPTLYRMNAVISDDFTVSTYWEPTDISILKRLKIPEYQMAPKRYPVGCFTNFDNC